ncbi:hypothetical protein DSO57_1031423 [Entomophthora muscae]|uniref:Uncharacterized protein n=1 Tax=Entomophthora muscae TaxID=34485 RepID=A0ACC2T0V1_9FUNG|nr:hypothetical protein DSO57_1031423 [Entomophthora muscae]
MELWSLLLISILSHQSYLSTPISLGAEGSGQLQAPVPIPGFDKIFPNAPLAPAVPLTIDPSNGPTPAVAQPMAQPTLGPSLSGNATNSTAQTPTNGTAAGNQTINSIPAANSAALSSTTDPMLGRPTASASIVPMPRSKSIATDSAGEMQSLNHVPILLALAAYLY